MTVSFGRKSLRGFYVKAQGAGFMIDCTPLWALRALVSLRPGPRAVRHTALLSLLALTAGCATTKQSGDTHQFAPMPRVEVGQAELGPVSTRPVADLLREAERAYQAANAAHQAGDRPEAMKQYKVMLARLSEAELDPSVFYSLRNKLEGLGPEAETASSAHPITGLAGGGKYNDIEIPFPLPERVLVEIDEIMRVYPGGFQAGLDRAQRYMPYIREELRKAGLPEELGWLCMVESQFAAKIDSPAGAGGMWQFMRPTARRYNLRVDNYVDERYNWVSSTRSAIDMLKYNHDFFNGDWALAIAAYNMGEGGLSRAMEANGGMADYWALIETPPASDRIKRETKKYYPRFLASIIVANNPQRYGFKVNPAPAERPVRVPVKAMYALSDIDQAMGVPSGTLARLNPDLIAEVTPPTGDYSLAVPEHMRETLTAALSKVQPTTQYAAKVKTESETGLNVEMPAGKTHNHRVKRGETISRIASKYGVQPQEVMAANGIRAAHHLRAGQSLKIPTKGNRASANNFNSSDSKGGTDGVSPQEDSRSLPVPEPDETYTVVRGDTLHGIATRLGVEVATLQQWNDMKGTQIAVGQKLMVASNNTSSSKSGKGSSSREDSGEIEASPVHVVESGEYPSKIARAYGMSLNEFLSLNKMTSDSTIHEGQEVKVRGKASSGTATAKKSAEPTVHTVAKGETASKIAGKYGVKLSEFLAWNGMTEKSVLREGQACKVYPSGSGGGGATASSSKRNNEDIKLAANKPSKTHVVARGHNPTSIARQYGVNVSDLYKWNGWSSNHVLQVGDRVKILD